MEDQNNTGTGAETTTPTSQDTGSKLDGVLDPDIINTFMPTDDQDPVSDEGQQTQAEDTPKESDGNMQTDGGVKSEPVNNPPNEADAQVTEALKQAQELVQKLQTQGQQVQQEQMTQEQQPEDPFTIPDYAFDIPDQLIASMNSEDPAERKQALGALIQGTAQTIHQQVTSQVQAVVQEISQTIPAMIQQQQQAMQITQQVQTDFYGKYPQLNNPQLKPFVAQVARSIMEQDLQKGIQPAWTPEFMERLGKEVMSTLSQAIPQEQTQTQSQPQPKPPAMFGGNTGGGANESSRMNPRPQTQADYIKELLGG